MDSCDSPYERALRGVTPEVYESLKLAVSLGHWGNGDKLTQAQKENSLQLIIAYEQKHIPEGERVAFLRKPGCKRG